MTDDATLLRHYVEDRSEAAFAEVVRRHLGLVYSVALRQVGGDVQLAEDVAQQVFTALARKARELSQRAVLGGWLYQCARFAAIDIARAESRRRRREQEAEIMRELNAAPTTETDWEQLRPILDEAANRTTSSAPRTAIGKHRDRRGGCGDATCDDRLTTCFCGGKSKSTRNRAA